jgi:hypothetical protein
MAKHSLLSVVKMCYEGYYVTFRIDGITIYNSAEKSILKGQQDLNTGLLHINLRTYKPHPYIPAANNVSGLHNKGALVNYLQKAIFSPTKYTLLQVVKTGHLTT